jgi:hypothetical protein
MNKREAKRMREEDSTPYAVKSQGRSGISLIHVTGYDNARKVRSKIAGAVILTAAEAKRLERR